MTTEHGRRLRLGMVGGGHGAFIGAVHRTAARLDDCYELVAGALASTPERALESGRDILKPGARNYSTFEQMVLAESSREDRIDVVSIVTPNDAHHKVAKAFLQAGIHVICDKPLTTDVSQAHELERVAKERGRVFVVTYNYSGYPLVRQAREMVAAGDLGELRLVHVEYLQGWLTERLEDTDNKQARWRTDPARSGPGGCLGDIATHAFHLAGFVSGVTPERISARLDTFVPGRRLDDNVNIRMRYASGAQGTLWASQVAPGHENDLHLRIYGSRGSLSWRQEEPNRLRFTRHGEVPRLYTRAGPALGGAANHATRIPGGHPEGYLEAFAQLYKDAAALIHARNESLDPPATALLAPTVREGAAGVEFIAAAIDSHRADAEWTSLLAGDSR
jgi:predicted dehydrogenase